MHRCFLLLLVLLLLPWSALGETGAERLAQLDIISQYDNRLQDERHYYKNMYFRIAGCKPASVTNAIVSLLGTPETDVPELLVELRNGLVYDRSNKEASIDLFRIPNCLQSPRHTADQLITLLKQVSNVVFLSRDTIVLDPHTLLSPHLANQEAHPLFLFEFSFSYGLPWLVNMAGALCELGHPDARFVLCAAGVGTNDTDGPFRLGNSGHYVTLYFQADEFHRSGTFYLLDSYPRALAGEDYGYRLHFPICYPFVDASRNTFTSTYAPTRISDTVLQFDLLPAELDSLHSSEPSTRAALQLQQFKTALLYSTPYFMLYIP